MLGLGLFHRKLNFLETELWFFLLHFLGWKLKLIIQFLA